MPVAGGTKKGASGLTCETMNWFTLNSSVSRCFGRSAWSPPSVHLKPPVLK